MDLVVMTLLVLAIVVIIIMLYSKPSKSAESKQSDEAPYRPKNVENLQIKEVFIPHKKVEGTYCRGTQSERLVVNTLRSLDINPQTIFHDVYFKKTHNFFVQVDIIVPTRVGILVFEVKDYKGWIYGNGMQPTWTQVLAYGKHKYHFYNPIMQNQEHIRHIKSMCYQLTNIPFFSIVVFADNCQLQDIKDIPENTFLVYDFQVAEVVRSILNNNRLAPYTDKMEIMRLFQNAYNNGANPYVVEWHNRRIHEMHGGDRR